MKASEKEREGGENEEEEVEGAIVYHKSRSVATCGVGKVLGQLALPGTVSFEGLASGEEHPAGEVWAFLGVPVDELLDVVAEALSLAVVLDDVGEGCGAADLELVGVTGAPFLLDVQHLTMHSISPLLICDFSSLSFADLLLRLRFAVFLFEQSLALDGAWNCPLGSYPFSCSSGADFLRRSLDFFLALLGSDLDDDATLQNLRLR